MTTKYPTLAFTVRDVQEILESLHKVASGITVTIQIHPSKTDPLRVCVFGQAFRRALTIGSSPRLEHRIYMASNKPGSLDKAVFDILWKMHDDVEAPPALWGTYTELAPGFPRRKK